MRSHRWPVTSSGSHFQTKVVSLTMHRLGWKSNEHHHVGNARPLGVTVTLILKVFMDIKEKINKQSAAGFSDTEIYSNLLSDGHSREEIDKELKVVSEEIRRKNQITPIGILLGSIFFIIVLFRINRFTESRDSSEAFLYLLPIATGIIVMVYWFSRKKG